MTSEPAPPAEPAGSAKSASGASSRKRLLAIAAGLYLLVTVCVLVMAPAAHRSSHTPYNHYALQAQAWLAGRLDLGGPPPRYTGNNDFARRNGKYYVSFPPVPAVLLLPFVAASDSVENVRDGYIFMWLSGLGPMLLFLTLERLRRDGRNPRRELQNALLAVLFALGSVFWFSAAQGTVWFAGHVVAVAFCCGFLLCSVRAEQPLLAGLCLALAVGTRPSLAFALPVFGYELWRQHSDRAVIRRKLLAFSAPLLLVGALLAWHNQARFGDPLEFGHRLLAIRWQGRIQRWGLFSPHYLGRNLAVVFAGLPFYTPAHGVQVNGHGLALWFTTPLYVWALWPRRTSGLFWALALSALAVATPALLYQNTGWIQFGYRFSNDFAPMLFLMIALGARRLSLPFWFLAVWSVLVNSFGAVTFGKAEYRHRYFIDGSQRILVQPD